MNTDNDLRRIPLRPVPAEWRTRILANAACRHPKSPWLAVLWPHPAVWVTIAAAWLVVVILSLTGRRGKDLYAFGPDGAEHQRISPEAYALYIARCAEFDLKRPAQISPLRRSEL